MFIPLKFEGSVLPRLLAPLLAGLLVSAAYNSGAQAETTPSAYVISDQDGYGVLECLTQRSDCGKIVADAWCESHGHGPARAFGRAEDLTAAIPDAASRQPPETGAAVVSCSD